MTLLQLLQSHIILTDTGARTLEPRVENIAQAIAQQVGNRQASSTPSQTRVLAICH
jgi:hypothetical protein